MIIANSDGLSRGHRLGDKATLTASPAATLFLSWYFATAANGERAREQPGR